MRLQLVTGPLFRVKCLRCGKADVAGDKSSSRILADINGAPFKAYYHEFCLTIRERLEEIRDT